MSRAAIQSSRASVPAVSIIDAAASGAIGRGSLFWNRGARVDSTAVASNPSRSDSQRMKLFTAESLRASERAVMPPARSCAIQARMSRWPIRARLARPCGPPMCPAMKARNPAVSRP